MLLTNLHRASARSPLRRSIRCISTLQSNPHIYVFPNASSPSTSHILSFLPTDPPSQSLSIGTTTKIPPTPDSLTENPKFLTILQDVLRLHSPSDPLIQGQAAAFASSSGSALGSGGMFFPQQSRKRNTRKTPSAGGQGDGAGGASSQGGAGGGGRGGWVHVSDMRAPPDYGRIAWPEDIFGSLEVDAKGEFVKGDEGGDGTVGNWQGSGTYRVITREGILGLTDFLRGKLVERLREEEKKGSI